MQEKLPGQFRRALVVGVEQYAKPGHSAGKCTACTFVVRAAYAAAEARHRVFQHPFVKPQARRRINAA